MSLTRPSNRSDLAELQRQISFLENRFPKLRAKHAEAQEAYASKIESLRREYAVALGTNNPQQKEEKR